jgi:elongator complex protein 2
MATSTKKQISELDLEEDIQPDEKYFSVIVQDDTAEVLYFAVSLESVLAGHEGWVYGIDWHPPIYSGKLQRSTKSIM